MVESFNCSVLIQGICTVTSHICICINVSFVNGSFCQENQSLLFFKRPYFVIFIIDINLVIYGLYFLQEGSPLKNDGSGIVIPVINL